MRSFLPGLRSLRLRCGLARLSGILTVVLFAALAAAQASPEYILGPEDVIAVNVLRHPEFSGEFYVPRGGQVEFPGVGPVAVAGKTLSDVSKVIHDALASRLIRPEVSTTLKTPRPLRINVLGDVKTPGAYDLRPGWRITEAIAAAQGLSLGTPPADCTVSVNREDTGKRESVPLMEALHGSLDENLVLRPGDTVYVESLQSFPIYVVGKVLKPGLYTVREDGSGVLAAISLAGGLAPDASTSNVTITHLSGQVDKVNVTPNLVKGQQAQLPALHSGDLISVPELQSRILLMGWLKLPGVYPLPDGKEITLADAISLAQGTFSNRARLSKVAVVNMSDGHNERIVYNFGRFLDKGDMTQNPKIKAGDVIYVPETNSIDWSSVLNGLASAAVLFAARIRL